MFERILMLLKTELENQALAKHMGWNVYDPDFVSEIIEAVNKLDPAVKVEFVEWEVLKQGGDMKC